MRFITGELAYRGSMSTRRTRTRLPAVGPVLLPSYLPLTGPKRRHCHHCGRESGGDPGDGMGSGMGPSGFGVKPSCSSIVVLLVHPGYLPLLVCAAIAARHRSSGWLRRHMYHLLFSRIRKRLVPFQVLNLAVLDRHS